MIKPVLKIPNYIKERKDGRRDGKKAERKEVEREWVRKRGEKQIKQHSSVRIILSITLTARP